MAKKYKRRKLKKTLIFKKKHFKLISYKNKKLHLSEKQKKNRKTRFNKKRFWNWFMMLANLGILAFILISNLATEGAQTTLTPFINWKFALIAIGLVILYMLVDATKYYILIRKSTKKSRPFLSYKVAALGRYYDNITPMSTGGQPFQMMYLNKYGIKGDVATSIPLTRYMFWQIIFVIVSSVVLIYNAGANVVSPNLLVNTVAWTSVIINAVILLTVLVLSTSKKVGPRIVIWILKLLSKIKIIKNYQKTFRKVMRFVINYQKTMRYFASNFFVIVAEIFLAIVDTVIWNIIPYFIYRTFLPIGTPAMGILEVAIMSLVCNLALGFIPTPGASGGAEGMFYIIFGNAFTQSGMFWPVLAWRFSTYYFYLLQGLFVLLYDFVIGNKKAERLKREGVGVYAENRPSFKNELDKHREKIEIVSVQEADKLPINLLNQQVIEENIKDEIIKGDLVTKEEIIEVDKRAEKLIEENDKKREKKKK